MKNNNARLSLAAVPHPSPATPRPPTKATSLAGNFLKLMRPASGRRIDFQSLNIYSEADDDELFFQHAAIPVIMTDRCFVNILALSAFDKI